MRRLVIALLLAGCDKPLAPAAHHVWVCDKGVQERALLGCIERAKHPDLAVSSQTAASEVVESCASAAKDVACRYVIGGVQR